MGFWTGAIRECPVYRFSDARRLTIVEGTHGRDGNQHPNPGAVLDFAIGTAAGAITGDISAIGAGTLVALLAAEPTSRSTRAQVWRSR